MRRFLLVIILLLAAAMILVNGVKQKVKDDLAQPFSATQLSPTPVSKQTVPITSGDHDKTSIFVPYWTLESGDLTDSNYDQYLYFGVTPAKNGIDKDEKGYENLDSFITSVPSGKEKLLVLRMLESDSNFEILKNKQLQQKVINDTKALAKQNGFDGVVLDLELSAIPFDSLIAQIRDFNADFYSEVNKSGLTYGITIYGDTFYRLRPFDIKAIAKSTDKILVMAYDLHKSRGNPGPNFPLAGKNIYGYDMQTMSDDFLQFVPKEKMTVVFGLFGYDWEVDTKGNATSHGAALTDNEITKQFISGCSYDNCSVKRDQDSKETIIHYTNDDHKTHNVWFEDMESVKAKQSYLRGKGINSFSFWANSYF
jgi:spore germination protein YaaH